MNGSSISVGAFLVLVAFLHSSLIAQTSVRRSFDGVDLPPITFPVEGLGPRDKKAAKFELLNSYLNRAPEELGRNIRSAKTTESENMLNTCMSRYEDADTSKAFTTGDGKERHEIYHGKRRFIDKLPNSWFVKDVGGLGADVVGFELSEGVISRLTLYYPKPSRICDVLIEAAKTQRSPKYVYRVLRYQQVTYIDVLGTAPIYLATHPHIPVNVRKAMEDFQLIDGMEMEQAEALMGKPDLHYVLNGNAVVSIVEMDGYRATEFRLQGRPAYSWTLLNGTVWTAYADRDGLLSHVSKREG